MPAIIAYIVSAIVTAFTLISAGAAVAATGYLFVAVGLLPHHFEGSMSYAMLQFANWFFPVQETFTFFLLWLSIWAAMFLVRYSLKLKK